MSIINAKETTFELFYNEKRGNTDLSVYEYGWGRCCNDKFVGPQKREYYLIHYISKGKGIYSIDNKTFELSQGDLFLIVPNKEHFYKADSNEPWEYYWIGFHGLEVEKMLKEAKLLDGKYTFHPSKSVEEIFKEIRKLNDRNLKSKYLVLSRLYELFATLLEDAMVQEEVDDENKDLVSKIMKYILDNYSSKLKIEDIAKKFGISRSYMFRLFKEKLNLSISDYILNVRLTKACLLLKNPQLKNNQITSLCGFSDYGNFLKTFKKKYGVSPRQYRKDPFVTTE